MRRRATAPKENACDPRTPPSCRRDAIPRRRGLYRPSRHSKIFISSRGRPGAALLSQPLEQGGRKVALSEGWDDDHDRLAGVLGTAADVDSGRDRRAGRDADRDAFKPRRQPRRVEGRLVSDGYDLVDDAAIEDGGREARPDSLDLVRPRGAARQHRRIFRLDRDDPHLWLVFL